MSTYVLTRAFAETAGQQKSRLPIAEEPAFGPKVPLTNRYLSTIILPILV